MTTTTQELIEQISKLDEQQQRILLELARKMPVSKKEKPLTLAKWLAVAQQSRTELRAKYGEKRYFNSQALLDEIREEESGRCAKLH